MWRNFRFLYMTNVEKSEISPHVDLFHMTNVEKSEISFIISDLRCFVPKSFCRVLRAIAWRKFEPKIVPVEKKLQI